jgi:hypothetical protein
MIEIFEKRGSWCYRDAEGKLFKFDTEEAAKSSLGLEIVDNGSETKKDKEEGSTKKKSTPSFGVSEENSESESEEE